MGRGAIDIEVLRKSLPREILAAPWPPSETPIITIGVIRASSDSPVSISQIRDHIRRMQVLGIHPHEMRKANGFGLIRHLDQLRRGGVVNKSDEGYVLSEVGETKLARLMRTRPDVIDAFEKGRDVESIGLSVTLSAATHKNLLRRSFG